MLVDFKKENRVELENRGLKFYQNKLKDKICAEPSYKRIIYRLNIIDIDYVSGESLYSMKHLESVKLAMI